MTEQRLFSRRGLLVILAVLGLTVSLATRVFGGEVHHSTSIYSASSCPKVQHRDSDASRWVPPVATYALLWTSEPSTSFHPLGQIRFHPHYDSLYNRPPPLL